MPENNRNDGSSPSILVCKQGAQPASVRKSEPIQAVEDPRPDHLEMQTQLVPRSLCGQGGLLANDTAVYGWAFYPRDVESVQPALSIQIGLQILFVHRLALT